MEKRKIWMIGLVVLLIIGVVSIFAVSAQTGEGNQKNPFCGKNKQGIFSKGFRSHSGFLNHSAELDKFKEQLNLSEDATKEDILEALKEKKGTWKRQHATNLHEKHGLPVDVTDDQVREDWKQKREADYTTRLERVKGKLGLSEDASEEEVHNALKKWREENKDLIMFFGNGGRGYHHKIR